MRAGIGALHCVGMAAAYFLPRPELSVVPMALDPGALSLLVSLAALLVLALAGFVAIVDRRLRTAERSARETRAQLNEALDNVSEAFSLFDAEDRLVVCNRMYREVLCGGNPDVVPGAAYEGIIRAAALQGLSEDAKSGADAWIEQRMAHHHDPRGPLLIHRSEGRWLQANERKTAARWRSYGHPGAQASRARALADTASQPGPVRDNGRLVNEATNRLVLLVKSLKSFARLDEAALHYADLHEGLESALALLGHKAGGGIRILREYGELPSLHCYPGELIRSS